MVEASYPSLIFYSVYQTPVYDKSNLDEILPCVVFAIRGRSSIVKWSNMVGPRDPILARHTDKDSLNAQYGHQLCEMRQVKEIPSGIKPF